jgi:hypothetical protein
VLFVVPLIVSSLNFVNPCVVRCFGKEKSPLCGAGFVGNRKNSSKAALLRAVNSDEEGRVQELHGHKIINPGGKSGVTGSCELPETGLQSHRVETSKVVAWHFLALQPCAGKGWSLAFQVLGTGRWRGRVGDVKFRQAERKIHAARIVALETEA